MKTFILSAGTVLPVSSKPINGASVLVSDGKIREVSKTGALLKKHAGIPEIKLGKGILLPGFVNGHTHLELGWTQTEIGAFTGFTGWLEQLIISKGAPIPEETIAASVSEGVKSLVSSGVTTVGEISSYGGLDKPILEKSGLRTVLFREILDSNEHRTDFNFKPGDGLIEERSFPHAPYSCSPRLLRKVFRSHHKNGIPFGIHLAESTDEVEFVKCCANKIEGRIFPLIGKGSFERPAAGSPYEYFSKMGLSEGDRVTLIHMVRVGEEEAGEISRLGLGVVLCPRSNLFLQVGAPPVASYSGIERLGIGTDSLSTNYNLDFFEELRAFHLLMSQAMGDKAAFKTVHAATLGGAGALYIENKTGSIDPDKDADLIYIDAPGNFRDPYLSVISSASSSLGMVMTAGRVLYKKDGIPLPDSV
ncbi:MAG: amidohydrolase family protein [Candidatus Dadabacteria bacterium]|nr:amidohydrolase family protein [Candidatus Dadabacteria bacterium]